MKKIALFLFLIFSISAFGAGAVEQFINYGIGTIPFSPVIGDIDGDGWPEIVISSRSTGSLSSSSGRVRAVRINEDSTITTLWNRDYGRACWTPAIADIDSDGTAEIFLNVYFYSPYGDMGVICLDGPTGNIEWQTDLEGSPYTGTTGHELVLADYDGDGHIEVISEQNWGTTSSPDYNLVILDASTGGEEDRILLPMRAYASPICEDINDDGNNEIICALTNGTAADVEVWVWDNEGNVLWHDHGGPPAVADIDLDGNAEIICGYVDYVGGDYPYNLLVYTPDGILQDTLYVELSNSTFYTHYECPVIGDFDPATPGPEVAFAVNHVINPSHPTSSSYCRVTVVRNDGSVVWQTPFFDDGEIISMSGADLDCDGIIDLCSYNMAGEFIVFRGYDGYFWTEFDDFEASPNPDPNRFVAIADMDNDCHAEFAVSTYQGSSSDNKGVYIYGDDANWNPVRRLWNTGTYYYTNVDDDLRLDTEDVSNHHWRIDNIWRAQRVIRCGLEIIPGPELYDRPIRCADCDTIGELTFDVTYWNPTCETIAWNAEGILEWITNSDCLNYVVGQDTTALGNLEPETDTTITYTLEIDPDCDSLEIEFWIHLTCINSLFVENRHMNLSLWTPYCSNRPVADLVRPAFCGRVISCGPSDTTGIVWTETGQDIIYNVSGDSITSSSYELDTLAMRLHIESRYQAPEDIYITDSRLYYDGDQYFGGLFYTPDPMYPHGDKVVFWLENVINDLGCVVSTPPCSMIIDDRPPDTIDVNPNHNELVNYSDLDSIYAVMTDDFMDIDPTSVLPERTSISINGVPVAGFNVDIRFDGTDPDTIFFENVLTTAFPGDTIEVCLWDMFDTVEDTMFCGANRTPMTCWFFIITAEEPVARIIHPAPNTYSACPDQQIIIEIVSEAPMDTMSMELEIDSVIHIITEEELYWDADSSYLIWAPDSGWWEHGNQANITLVHAMDVLGQEYANYPVEIDFWLDFEEPAMEFLSPQMGLDRWIRNRATEVAARIIDRESGFDQNSLAMWIAEDSIGRPPASLSDDGDGVWTLVYNPEISGELFSSGDTIVVEVRSCDTPDYCDPNCGVLIDSFIVEPEISCLVFPNPFTPNGDPVNPYAVFNFPHMFTTPGELVIFDVRNREVFRKVIEPIDAIEELFERSWDGRDNSGGEAPEGLYLYIIKQDNKIICNGTVILAR